MCPFSWITSRWIDKVVAQTDYTVDWRFISLRLVNKDVDYAKDFPPEYEEGHTAGLRMLRVAAAVRDEVGRDALGPLVAAYGHNVWDGPPDDERRKRMSTPEHAVEILEVAGLDAKFAEHLDNDSWDEMLDAEGELAFSRTGRDVGTPIITFQPPDGLSFFGPVISRVPTDEQAVPLWDAVTTLASFPGFAEMKRSMREAPQLAALGTLTDEPEQEDWTGGRRVGHLASERDDAA